MSIADAFADIALGFAAATGVGFHPAVAKWPGTPTTDAGGSITAPGTPVEKACSVQIDAATEAMRADPGFVDKDMRLLVLAATLEGEMDTEARVSVTEGPYAGTTWMVESVDRDPCGVYFECRGRQA